MTTCVTPTPIWQFAETNQRLLSVLALAAALGVAVFEYVQARRADRGRVVEPARIALNLVDQCIVACEEGKRTEAEASAAKVKVREAAVVIGKLSSAVPPNANLMVLLNNMQVYTDRFGNNPHHAIENAQERERIMSAALEAFGEFKSGLRGIITSPLG